jgi:tRNA (mo5U34)-methyltransferase
MNAQELRDEVERLRWWHRIDLGQGVVTPGRDDSPSKLAFLGMPADLRDKSVLDVGASDGFFSFEAERRGARRVVAVDTYYKDLPGGWRGHGTRSGFDLARRVLGSRVEALDLDCLDLSPENVGVHDVVLFLGVLYHLKHPLLGLERVASVTGELLILETHVDLLDVEQPAMAFYPGRELANDPTNWWGPNGPAVEAMLRTAGFRRTEVVHRHVDQPSGTVARSGRVVVHAWK